MKRAVLYIISIGMLSVVVIVGCGAFFGITSVLRQALIWRMIRGYQGGFPYRLDILERMYRSQ